MFEGYFIYPISSILQTLPFFSLDPLDTFLYFNLWTYVLHALNQPSIATASCSGFRLALVNVKHGRHKERVFGKLCISNPTLASPPPHLALYFPYRNSNLALSLHHQVCGIRSAWFYWPRGGSFWPLWPEMYKPFFYWVLFCYQA